MRWWFLTAISDLYLYIMNNMRFIFLCCVVLNSFLLFGQDDYNELSDSKYVDLEVWRKQKDDLCISWGDANKHYSSQNVPDVPICLKHKLKGWKGEKLNALFLIWSQISTTFRHISDNGCVLYKFYTLFRICLLF